MTNQPSAEKQPGARPVRQQLKLEIPAELQAQYANFVLIAHTSSEIIMDFAQVLPNMPKVRVQTRLLFTPTNAKLFHKALGEAIAKYENAFGEVQVPPSLADQLFGSLRPAADSSESSEDNA